MNEFKFRDTIRITSGFFDGQIGRIIDKSESNSVGISYPVTYLVSIVRHPSRDIWIPAEHLELIGHDA